MTTNKVLCIYHASCADGLGAAWAVHRALGPDVEFVAAKYGDLLPGAVCVDEIRGRDVLFVDFSAPLPVLRAMAAAARSVLVLDHHKTAQEDLLGLLPPTVSHIGVHGGLESAKYAHYKEWLVCLENPMRSIDGDVRAENNLAAIFDTTRSGAALAWDYLHPGDPFAAEPSKRHGRRPRIIDLIEDRDLWKFRFGDESRALHAVLSSYDWTDLPAMFERLDYLASLSVARGQDARWLDVLLEGSAILRAQQQAVRVAVAASRRTMRIAGHTVPTANVPPAMASEAGHLLCDLMSFRPEDLPGYQHPTGLAPIPYFSATYYDGPDRRHFSLRSPEGGADAGEIARRMAAEFNDARMSVLAHTDNLERAFNGGGHAHVAGFDAPLGWEGE